MVNMNITFATLLHNIKSKKSNLLLTNLYFITFATFLCTFFYLFGLWHHYPSTTVISATGYTTTTASAGASSTCFQPDNTTEAKSSPSPPLPLSSFVKLDFTASHHLPDPPPTTARVSHLPPCDSSLYEYTPCEDQKRSLRFPRNKLIYRERHCPLPEENLRCRIPAPFGYRLPLRWPESRDSAWYANVPHKELTVEKKKQNWIRFEGNRFKFPGGGTMFPRGASAYIDDVGKFINLKDGSIRTAIDTGCGVRILILEPFSVSVFPEPVLYLTF